MIPVDFSSSSISVFPWAEKTVCKVSKFVMLVLRRVQYFTMYIVTDLPSCETPETIHTGDRGRALGR